MASEFDLIARYFTHPTRRAHLGVGDDAALLGITPGMELAISVDMLVAGTHFLPDADPRRLGHKALAVNLSDLAAMGAQPRWALLSIALPQADEGWVAAFSDGFMTLAREYDVELIGGDTTRGPLNISVTILGEVSPKRALRRDAAKAGDEVWVSGELGGAALGLQALRGEIELDGTERLACIERLERPQPRIGLGRTLQGIAHAAIDISDGLLADLGHILEQSGLGAEIVLADIPASPALGRRLEAPRMRAALLAGGDDYELCFTAPLENADAVRAAGQAAGVRVTRIGVLHPGSGLKLLGPAGQVLDIGERGFDHFAA